MLKPNPTYYAVLPAVVRYDELLTSTAKLLYAEITALSNVQGFCSASNKYFATLYKVSPHHVSDLVTSLVGQGYITVEVDREAGNKRKIRLIEPADRPIRKNPDTPYTEKSTDPYTEKSVHNITSKNNTAHIASEPQVNLTVLAIYKLYLKYFIVTPDMNIAGAMRRYKLTPKRIAAIERRLKDGEPKMILAAIAGYGRANWSNGNNDRRWKADLADFICRNYENVERGARLYEDQQNNVDSDDAWAKL